MYFTKNQPVTKEDATFAGMKLAGSEYAYASLFKCIDNNLLVCYYNILKTNMILELRYCWRREVRKLKSH